MTQEEKIRIARKLSNKSRESGTPTLVPVWFALLTVSDLFGTGSVHPVSRSGVLIVDTPVGLVSFVHNHATYGHFSIPDDVYEKVCGTSFTVLSKAEKLSSVPELRWIDTKTIKATAQYFGCGSYHSECRRAFQSDRWVIEAENTHDMSTFPVD
jgi:hypothetical protein